MIDMCDELAELLEPDPTLRIDTRRRPGEYRAGRFYLWPTRTVYTLISQGFEDREQFTVTAAWAADRAGGTDADERAVSEAIDTRATAVRDSLAAVAGAGVHFEQAHVDEVAYNVSTPDIRGFTATISGYRIRR